MTEADRIDAEAAAHDRVGWSRLGYELRRPTWSDEDLGDVVGRTVLVTGATSGIGEAAAARLAELGARVVLVARDSARLRATATQIDERSDGPPVDTVACDLTSTASVRRAAAQIIGTYRTIDVLVNNAGVLLGERSETAGGLEVTWATNLLGPYLLTELLLDRLIASAPARVIEVTSGGLYSERIDVDDHQTVSRAYSGTAVYARTKRAQVILTEERAAQYAERGLVFHAMHPGWADTPGLRGSMREFVARFGDILRTPAQGADTIVWLAAAREPARTTGLLWQDRRPRETHRDDRTKETAEERARLVEILRRQAGL